MGTARRVFLGWDRPLVHTAAEWLAREFAVRGGGVDFTDVLMVVPGGRLGRNLFDRIGRYTGGVLGTALTIDAFLERVLGPVKGRPAGPWLRRLCWSAAAMEFSEEELEALWPAELRQSVSQQLAAAELIDHTHEVLTGEGVEFKDVVRAVESLDVPDASRWRALLALEHAYLDRLERIGCTDRATGRIMAAAEPIAPARVVLVGLSEVPGLVRRVLNRQEMEVVSLIAAPQAHADLFDELGTVQVSAWIERRVEIPEDMIKVVEGPDEQAELALAAAGDPSVTGGAEPALDPSDVVIGVPDEEVRRSIERTAISLAAPGEGLLPARVRSAAGEPCSQSAVARFLRAASEFLADPEFPQYSAFLRHADVERRIAQLAVERGRLSHEIAGRMLEFIDAYARDYVHGVVDGRWLGPRDARREQMHRVLDAAYAGVKELLGDLWSGNGESPLRPASAWSGAIVDAVRGLSDALPDPADEASHAAIESICRELRQGADLGEDEPHVTAAAALQTALAELARERRPLPQDQGAVELLGWLEAVHDPAPVLVLTSMNEGAVPRSPSDPLVPEPLRRALSLPARDAVLARDKYLLEQAISCRSRVILLSERRSEDGTRRWPSRLLLAEQDEVVVRRLARFLPPRPGEQRELPVEVATAGSGAATPAFELMPVTPGPKLTSISATAFSRYIQSPYAFYLQDVLKLREACEPALEMEANVFGTFIHRVLERFARNPASRSTDQDAMRTAIREALEAVAAEDLGENPPIAVAVQKEQAAYRLAGFVALQSERMAAGWQILETEWNAPEFLMQVGDEKVAIHGRIDRVDWNPRTGELALLDYKTGERMAENVRRMYDVRRAPCLWNDLQMPMYWLLARGLAEQKKARRIILGYITIPKDGEAELVTGDWEQDALEAGVDQARTLLKEMLTGAWQDEGASPPGEGTAGALCGRSVLMARPLSEPKGGPA